MVFNISSQSEVVISFQCIFVQCCSTCLLQILFFFFNHFLIKVKVIVKGQY